MSERKVYAVFVIALVFVGVAQYAWPFYMAHLCELHRGTVVWTSGMQVMCVEARP